MNSRGSWLMCKWIGSVLYPKLSKNYKSISLDNKLSVFLLFDDDCDADCSESDVASDNEEYHPSCRSVKKRSHKKQRKKQVSPFIPLMFFRAMMLQIQFHVNFLVYLKTMLRQRLSLEIQTLILLHPKNRQAL